MPSPNTGDAAPDFSAAGTGKKTYALSQFLGHPLVLIFYPGDATPVCTRQLTSYTEDFSQFADLGATVLALSPQDVESHEAFQAEHGISFPLLYDEEKEIGRRYGVLGPLGFYRRSVFVIDREGMVRFAKRSMAGLSYVKSDEIVRALKSC